MATTKERHMQKPMGRQTIYGTPDTRSDSFMSNFLTGLMLLLVLGLVVSIVHSVMLEPTQADSIPAPFVAPEGSPVPGAQLRDGRDEALATIAGQPGYRGSQAFSLDSKVLQPNTDRLPGRDDRKPEPLQAPL